MGIIFGILMFMFVITLFEAILKYIAWILCFFAFFYVALYLQGLGFITQFISIALMIIGYGVGALLFDHIEKNEDK